MDDVVRDATMMGVTAIEPLITAHTVAHMKPGGAPERWRRIAVASAKQCRRAVLPSIGTGTMFDDWLARDGAEAKLILVEPAFGAEAAAASKVTGEHADLPQRAPGSASLLVGPEGGWTTDEIVRARRAGYRTRCERTPFPSSRSAFCSMCGGISNSQLPRANSQLPTPNSGGSRRGLPRFPGDFPCGRTCVAGVVNGREMRNPAILGSNMKSDDGKAGVRCLA
jgi:hypothetical protein